MRMTVASFAFVLLSSLASSTLAEQRFPIDSEEYRQTIATRVEATWEKIEKKLDHHKVSDDRKQVIRTAFDEAVARIDEVMDKASSDGQISRGEAYRISTMTSGLRGKLRGKLAVGRGSESAADKPEPRGGDRAAVSKPATAKNAAKKGEEPAEQGSARKTGPARKADPNAAPGSPKARSDAKTKKARRS